MIFHYWFCSLVQRHMRERQTDRQREALLKIKYSPSVSSFTLGTTTEWKNKIPKNFDSFRSNILLLRHNNSSRHYPHSLQLHIGRLIGLYLQKESLYDTFQISTAQAVVMWNDMGFNKPTVGCSTGHNQTVPKLWQSGYSSWYNV